MRMERRNIASGAKWEAIVGYSRAVRVGPFIHVSGTTAWDETGEIVGLGDPYIQTLQAIRNIEQALAAAGSSLRDVVRTRTFVTDIGHWERVGRAHAECFGDVRPCATMVEVKALVNPKMLVEMEADAIVADAPLR